LTAVTARVCIDGYSEKRRRQKFPEKKEKENDDEGNLGSRK